jgi:hypothetical protein
MPRILADLPEDDIKWLETRAAEQGKSRDAILSEILRWNADRKVKLAHPD